MGWLTAHVDGVECVVGDQKTGFYAVWGLRSVPRGRRVLRKCRNKLFLGVSTLAGFAPCGQANADIGQGQVGSVF